MVNKRGWLRVVEMSISVILIFAVLVLISQRIPTQRAEPFDSYVPALLAEVAKDSTSRDSVFSYKFDGLDSDKVILSTINSSIGVKLNQPSVHSSFLICQVRDVCSLPAYPSDTDSVYTYERIVSKYIKSTVTYDTRKIKLFLWRSS